MLNYDIGLRSSTATYTNEVPLMLFFALWLVELFSGDVTRKPESGSETVDEIEVCRVIRGRGRSRRRGATEQRTNSIKCLVNSVIATRNAFTKAIAAAAQICRLFCHN